MTVLFQTCQYLLPNSADQEGVIHLHMVYVRTVPHKNTDIKMHTILQKKPLF